MAKKLYGLTEADRRTAREDHRRIMGQGGSRRPVATRRRVLGATAADPGPDHPVVQVTNNTLISRVFTNIVGLSTPLDTGQVLLQPRLPQLVWADPEAGKPFGVLIESIAPQSGQTVFKGDAAVTGAVPVILDLTDETHEYADCITGNTSQLASAATGPARILWRANQDVAGSGTLGVQVALVRLQAVSTGTGTAAVVAIIDNVEGGTWSDSTKTLLPDTEGPFACPKMKRENGEWVRDGSTLLDCEATFTTGVTVPANKARLAIVNVIDGAWVIVNADCGEIDWT